MVENLVPYLTLNENFHMLNFLLRQRARVSTAWHLCVDRLIDERLAETWQPTAYHGLEQEIREARAGCSSSSEPTAQGGRETSTETEHKEVQLLRERVDYGSNHIRHADDI